MLAEAPPLPDGCEQLWLDFLALHECRGSNGFGPSRISWRDLADWQAITGARLEPWQVDAISAADVAFMADWTARQPKPEK